MKGEGGQGFFIASAFKLQKSKNTLYHQMVKARRAYR